MTLDFPPSDLEQRQRRDLKRTHAVATGLLVTMAVVFLATEMVAEPGFWVRLLRAGTEAALVGGLADWFAVTALFRHPFGIPVPHTALIPRNKDRIGEGLGSFVERHFLDPNEVTRKLRDIDVAWRISVWLSTEEHAGALAKRLVGVVPYLVRSLENPEVREFLRRALREQLESFDLAPFLGGALKVMTEGNHHQDLVDKVIALLSRLLEEHEDRVYAMVVERSSWWIPVSIDQHVASVIVKAVHEVLEKLADPSHEGRARLNRAVAELIDNLLHSQATRDSVAALKEQVLESPTVRQYLAATWDELRRMVIEDAQSPTSHLRRALAGGLGAMGRALLEDAPMRARLNRRIEAFILTSVAPWRAEIGHFIASVVRRWDARTVSDRIEIEIGADLQYIRINGTVVGALVGCLLFLASTLMGG